MEVWQIDLDHPGELDGFMEVLDDQEKDRAGRFRFGQLTRRFVVAHAATRCLLAAYCGVPPADLVYEYGAHGKPALAHRGGPSFSLSHSDGMALCGIAAVGEIGVDIERCRDIHWSEMASRFFSGTECAMLEALSEEQRAAGFFACWTRKEAYIKAKGLGLSLPLETFSVEADPALPAALIASDYAPEDAGHFRMWDLPVPAGYRAAVAYCGAEQGPPGWRQWMPSGPAPVRAELEF